LRYAQKAAKAILKASFWLAFLWALLEAGVMLPTGPRSPLFGDAIRQALALFGMTYIASAALFFLHTPRRGAGDWFVGTLIWAIPLAAIPFTNVDWRWYAPDIIQDAWDAFDNWHFNAAWVFVGILAFGLLLQAIAKIRELAHRVRARLRGSERTPVVPDLNGKQSDWG